MRTRTSSIVASLLSLVLLVSMLGACAPATPQVVEKEVVKTVIVEKEVPVEKKVVETVIVEVEKEKPKLSRLRIGYDMELNTIDPGTSQDAPAWTPGMLVFGRLVEWDETMMDPAPGIAESWDISADNLTHTFHLRKGVKFHTGREVTADDVVYSWDRGFEIGPKGRFAGHMKAVETYKALDPYTFEVKLTQPDITFMTNVGQGSSSVVDRETIDQINKSPIGTGPYQFVEWIPGERILYRKFQDYWDADKIAGWPDEVETITIPETQTRIANLQAGATDIAVNIPVEFRDQITSDPNLHLVLQPFTVSYLCVIFNLNQPPFQDNKLLRQAIARAIDTETINRNVFLGNGEVGCNLLPSTHWAYTDIGCYSYDPEEAKRLLTEAGYPDGLTVNFRTFVTPEWGVPAAEIIQANLKAIGIKAEIEPLDWGFYVQDAWVGKNFEMTLAWYTRDPDPDGLFSSVLRKDQGNNPMGYHNTRVEELFDKGKSSTDREERKKIYEEIMKITMLDDTPVAKIQTMTLAWAANDNVQGFYLYPKGYPNWLDWTWKGE